MVKIIQIVASTILISVSALAADTYCNPLDVFIADPFVLHHDGTYFLYGTARPRSGFEVWTGKDLVHWQNRGLAWQPLEGQWPRTMFWAPEVFEHHGKFYLHGSATGDIPDRHRIILCEGDSPLGPFKLIKGPWYDLKKSNIDSDVFRDDDGKLYLYFVMDARDNVKSEIYVRKLKDDLTDFDGPPVYCIRPEQHWEGTLINEGPFVVKHGKTYYLMYSGNGATDTWYAVGYATSQSPMGPWKKFEQNPILRKTKTVSGPGHHSVIDSPDGTELFVVYHTHQQPAHPTWARQLAIDRMSYVESSDGSPARIVARGPTDSPQPMPAGARAIVRGQSDEFDADQLDRNRWSIVSERPDHWSLGQGDLVIHTQEGEAQGERADFKNVFLADPPDGDFAATTHLQFHPEKDKEEAFICLWQNHNEFLRLALCHDNDTKFQVTAEHAGKFEVSNFQNKWGDDVYLRIERRGEKVSLKVSGDGKDWTQMGTSAALPLSNVRVGLGAFSPGSKRDIPARFDFLHFEALGEPLESAPTAR